MQTAQRALLTAAVAATLVLTGCSSKAVNNSSGGGSAVKTDVGVTDQTITLGVLTDASGVFKNLGLGITHGNEIWADEVNRAGGICGRKIALVQKDHGYAADKAIPLYGQVKDNVLGLAQLLGSPILAALKKQITDDKMVSVPASWASTNLDTPSVLMVGATYDVEMLNGFSFMQEQGFVHDGDRVGHIYVDSEYGKNGLAGSKAYGAAHNLTVVEAKVTATDTDMTAAITSLKSQGVKAIALTTTPKQTASALTQAKAQGIDVPFIGNNPTFDPVLLSTPAKDSFDKFYFVNGVVPFSADLPAAKDLAAKYAAKYTDTPNVGVDFGYASGLVWQSVLTTACNDKDLTRQGVLNAVAKTKVDTKELAGELDFSKPGQPSSRKSYIAQADATVPGGMKYVKQLFESPEAASYRTPFQH
ncbi:ABC transporter substrate-binding protein [Gandjariella thermophila]|uniref:Branched-chain amino acid ABC transporter substrate-binding protein n=1 Tax=Gandjariella thermophila TaxID=1931992 RepID=A0A4D4JH33_9PSEU|nr:ABC transporter substrate-binding protein [Gandjariella thermophila]GDY33706.1 branched-chain amino acid ABC transporter substrate-binding protein [Gandjariella thermophila]